MFEPDPKKKINLTRSMYLSWGVSPCQVGKMRVHRHSNYFTVYIPKLISFVTEGNDLCGTYKRAAEWAEMKH